MFTHSLSLYAKDILVKVIHGTSQVDCYKQLDEVSVNAGDPKLGAFIGKNAPLFDTWELTVYNPSLVEPTIVTRGKRQWVIVETRRALVNTLVDGLTQKQINRYMDYGKYSIAIYNLTNYVVSVLPVYLDYNVTKQNAYEVTLANGHSRIVYAHNLLSAKAMA